VHQLYIWERNFFLSVSIFVSPSNRNSKKYTSMKDNCREGKTEMLVPQLLIHIYK
jgi:hypothetical protein